MTTHKKVTSETKTLGVLTAVKYYVEGMDAIAPEPKGGRPVTIKELKEFAAECSAEEKAEFAKVAAENLGVALSEKQ